MLAQPKLHFIGGFVGEGEGDDISDLSGSGLRKIRYASRSISSVVLPVPAPAVTTRLRSKVPVAISRSRASGSDIQCLASHE
jgi:hypothetical protein